MAKTNTIISSLVFSNLVTGFPQLIASLLLIEIGLSFGVSVGVAGQIKTVAFVVSVIMGLVVGGLSVKVKHKSLLVMGLGFLIISSVGCFLAPNLIIMSFAFSLTGFSTAIVGPMGRAMVGRYFPSEQKTKIVGLLLAGATATYIIGPPLIGVISDWRLAFMVLSPLVLFTLCLTIRGLPSESKREDSSSHILQGFKAVLANKSALACLLANVFSVFGMVVLVEYGLSFYRQSFQIDTGIVSLMLTSLNLIFCAGFLLGGRLVQRVGTKSFTVISTFLYGVLILLFVNVASVWLSVILWYLAGLMCSFRDQAYTSLILDQVPAYRGTMMSLSSLTNNLALAIGTSMGGLILLSYDYALLGLFGFLILIGAFIFHFFTIDPTKQMKQS